MSALRSDSDRARAAARSRRAESGSLTEMARLLLREAREAEHRGARRAERSCAGRAHRRAPSEQAEALLRAA